MLSPSKTLNETHWSGTFTPIKGNFIHRQVRSAMNTQLRVMKFIRITRTMEEKHQILIESATVDGLGWGQISHGCLIDVELLRKVGEIFAHK